MKSTGTYTVTGSNARGCEKTKAFNVLEDPLPNVGFTLSGTTIDNRHNQLTVNVPAQTKVQYRWNMGDGTTETGSTIVRTYNIPASVLGYAITLTTTNQNGCINTPSKEIDVIPFVPNVFTPNGDGVNDKFMPGLDLQVFDRCGLQLYKGTAGSTGTLNGKTMDQDTYFYQIHYMGKNKKTQTLKGYIMLMK